MTHGVASFCVGFMAPSLHLKHRNNARKALLKAPVNMCAKPRQMIVLEIGTGCDLHGQDVTKAATRACRNAVEFNSLPVLRHHCPGGDLSSMLVKVKLGVPEQFLGQVDEAAVTRVFPYGTKEIEVVPGGLVGNSGIYLPDQEDLDGDMRAIVVVAAVEVHC
jgi:uncharacterized protein (TIGR02058 family)